MEKSTSGDRTPDSRTARRALKDRKQRANGARHRSASGRADALAERLETSLLDGNASTLKPLLLGVGIGAALVGTAVMLRSKNEKGISPFHGPNAALAGALTKSALLAFARVASGDTVRSVATRALLEVAEAWKA